MARYSDAVCKLCRREEQKLFLKGERCLGPKCAIERRNYPPGDHGKKATFRRKVSDYGRQLREKQKARRVYGVMEKQFRRYFREATRRKGLTGVDPAGDSGEPAGQRRVSYGICRQPGAGAPVGASRSFRRERPQDGHPFLQCESG